MSAAGFSASSSAARGLFQYNSTSKKEKYHLHHGKKIPFQFSSIGSTSASHSGSSGARPHLAHQGSSSVSSTHSIASLSSSLRRPAQATHFYIPGEVEGPYPVSAFPTVKHIHHLSIDNTDDDRLRDAAASSHAAAGAASSSSHLNDDKVTSQQLQQQHQQHSNTFTLWRAITSSKLWTFLSAAFKKGKRIFFSRGNFFSSSRLLCYVFLCCLVSTFFFDKQSYLHPSPPPPPLSTGRPFKCTIVA